ncbi:MAG: hypothetical protein FWB74_03770 [Defluviitaleaceae bacterium]|nr:hypothetical protein [Defluviitaleaceae bacterium]
MKQILAYILKVLLTSLTIALITSFIALIYALISQGSLIAAYAFTANFVVGVVVILAGLVVLLMPLSWVKDKLLDHSTFGERTNDARERKRKRSHEILYIGMCVIILAGIAQYIHHIAT